MRNRASFSLKFVSLLAILLAGALASAHQGHDHNQAEVEKSKAPDPGSERAKRLEKINETYLAKIKPIFMAKCFDCHSEQTTYPWYYAIPGVKQFINSDIAEAKEHIEMTHDFPFRGHGKPEEDLDAIVETTAERDMPPWYYRIMHSGSGLTDDEAKSIIAWAKESRELLFWDKK